MQIEVKKENIEEDGEGKRSKKMNLYSWSLEIKIENGGGSTSEKAQEHKNFKLWQTKQENEPVFMEFGDKNRSFLR